MDEAAVRPHPEPWNKGKLVGQKAPFKLKEIWAIRVRLQLFRRVRDLALFDLGIDSKLRACDLVRLKVREICHGDRVTARAIVMQQKTSRPVQFEITESTREAVAAWIKEAGLRSEDYLFPSRLHELLHLSTRQYAHIVDSWVEEIGLDPANYGTHSMRRTKAFGIPTLSMREHAAICGCRQPSLRNSSKHVPRSQGYSGNTIPRLIVRCPRPMATASHTSRKAHDVLLAPDPGHCEARNAGLPKIYQKGITDGQRAEQEHGRGRGGTIPRIARRGLDPG